MSAQERERRHLIPALEILQARGQDSHVMFPMIAKLWIHGFYLTHSSIWPAIAFEKKEINRR